MIDFQSSGIFKLSPIDVKSMRQEINKLLLDDEKIFSVFKSLRDQLVFTDKRVIAVNVQGLSGKKVDYTSIPFSKIQAFSIETSGTFDMDSEIEIYISAIGKIKFDIRGNFDIVGFSKILGKYVL